MTTAACSGAQPPEKGAAPGGAYPVTIEHKYGSTTIASAPKRVVTVGLTEQDSLLALGVVPVATTKWIGAFPGEIGPWASGKLGGAGVPEVLQDTSGPQFEKIAALRPDVIIGLYSGMTKESYDKLSQIAPTVAQPKEYTDFGIPWQETTKQIGRILGKQDDAAKLVQGVEDRFAKVRKENPKFEGASAVMATIYDGYFVYGSQDPRSRLLTSLGFKLPADLDAAIGDKFGANISAERTDLLDRDALIWVVGTAAEGQAKLASDRLYSGLKVAKEKREVFVEEGTAYGHATSFVSVLSLPFQLDRLVPQLAAAVDGDPGTPVKPAS
ncbi:iron-siderophore ABC transporter substrate-binding protein [Amycolatopsis sp. CA-230715]|uniref:iron-siderophore ABC transporter substrate-binding protein n=1 Tax=Amycolatopsis sp. CA-230715 TaxID=2745196 RepID=UPI001C03076D|nr:iron-siderophore ABC transporter substrate-binding protein [Amycolatopsis sp. CA-230715]